MFHIGYTSEPSFALVYIERVELEKQINTPLYVKISRKKSGSSVKASFTAETVYQHADSNNIVHFNSEFHIPITIFRKKGEPTKKLIAFQLITMNEKKKKPDLIGEWKFDVGGFDSKEIGLKSSSIETSCGKTTIFVRIVVIPKEDLPDQKPPEKYFSFVTAKTETPEFVFQNDQSQSDIENEEEGMVTLFDENANEVKLPAPPATQPPPPERKHHHHKKGHKKHKHHDVEDLPEELKEELKNVKTPVEISEVLSKFADLSVERCSIALGCILFKTFIIPPRRESNFAQSIVDVISSYGIFKLEGLTESHISTVFNPIYRAIEYSLASDRTIDSRVNLLSTVVRMGLLIATEAGPFCDLQKVPLKRFEDYIAQMIEQLEQDMLSAIAPTIENGGFVFLADEAATATLSETTEAFKNGISHYGLQQQIVQEIIVGCCSKFDVLLFNVLLLTASRFSVEDAEGLLERLKHLQRQFDCLSANFNYAFPRVLRFVSMCQALAAGVPEERLQRSQALWRALADRLDPPPVPPEGIEWANVSEPVDPKTLREEEEADGFRFSFEWLFLENVTQTYDAE